jgi:hypothetical protein
MDDYGSYGPEITIVNPSLGTRYIVFYLGARFTLVDHLNLREIKLILIVFVYSKNVKDLYAYKESYEH